MVGASILAAALAACGGTSGTSNDGDGGTPRRGGTLIVGEDSQPLSGFDPIMAQAFNAKRMVAQFYEGLLSLGEDGQTIEPGLATEWNQTGDLTYEFTLRDGVKFHDGSDLTAEDVVFSLERIVDPEQHSPYSSLYNFKAITAPAANKVVIELSEPQASLLHLLAQPWSAGIVSKKWVESTDADEQKTKENGTGPFKLKEFREGSLISTVRFDDYWDEGKPYLDGVDFRLMADESTRISAFTSGSIDMMQARVPKNAEAVKAKGLNVGPAYNLSYWVGLNMTDGALANPKVRQAISVGIDREQLIEIGSQGAGELAYTVPPADPLGSPATKDTPNYQYDPEQAKQLLAESGEKDVRLKLILQSENQNALPTAQLLAEQLGKIGIEVDVVPTPFSTLVSNLLSGKWDADMIVLNAALNADASQYLALWFAKDSTATKVDDPKLWQMMSDAVTTTGGDEDRKARYQEIGDYIAENVYQIVPYAAPSAYDMWTKKLHGFTADASGTRILLKNAWMG
ncbi:ABC transporter substrate-binding protein [Nocardioides nitrophenolicus]|uniref:ABC transporter substrate-binding protein n=1 Tax=Nocardioides nitrophenolicus TaxID=60489 RepID=UPI00195A16A6|nr:ABC transporter substrate-binding protein [Nocardioides nitrophenolicus]MBM7517079.1 ABC-type transport system substrate-binding protein [Nocardioides nitrophenolicus]